MHALHPAARTVALSQLWLYVCLTTCIMLRPAVLSANDGISYFGVYQATVVPYALGLLGAACGTARAISALPADETIVRRALTVYVPLVVGIVITPYAAGPWVDGLHTAFGSALFFLQLVLSGWLVWRLRYVWWSVLLGAIELGAGILSAAYLNPLHGFLFQSQVAFQAAFGGLLVLSLHRLLQGPDHTASNAAGGQHTAAAAPPDEDRSA